MSDDFTTTRNYGLFKPVPNADYDLWGDHLNANADTIDGLIGKIDARGSGGGVILISDYLPSGQPDGATDLAPYFQQAIDAAAGADPANRAAAPGFAQLLIPAAPAPYIIGKSLYVPSHSHIVFAHGATLKLAPQTHDHMFLLCNFAHHVLIELYGTLDGNSSQQFFKQNSPGVSPPPTDMPPTSISGGITTDTIWGGPARNPVVQGGICSHVKIIGDRNGLITNFQNQPVGLNGATNCEVSDISLTNSAFHAGSVGVSGWRNFPYDPAAGTPLTFTGTFVAATGVVTLTTNVPHCMVPGEEFITEQLTGTGGFNAATGKLFITLAGTAGNTIVYAATGGGVGTDGSITGGRITNWFYQQATIVSGTYVPATGVITVTTTAPHQLVYGQTISSNITGGTAAAIATGIFQLLDVTDGAGEPPISDTKATTLRYRTTRTGTTENIVSGVYDSPSGTVTLTTDAPHGLSPGDVVTVSATGSGFLQTLNAEQVCITGTLGTTIRYATLSGLTGIVISGGTVYGGSTLTISAGTIGVSTKCWNSGFDNCFMDQIRDIGPCIYGGGVGCYIRNSEITRNLGSGPFLFSDANSGRCVDCEISGNYIHDNLGAGVGAVNFGTGNIPHTGTRIFNNYVTGNRGGAGFDSCDGLECADNYFYKNRAVGLNTYGSVGEITVGPGANRVRITGNTLRDPCLISTTMAGTTLTQVVSGTYNNATGAVSLTTAIPHNLFTNAYFTLSATTGTGAHASIEGRYVAEASTGPTILNFHAPAGLGTITITGGQLVPNGFGIVIHGADRLYIADNFIGDYQSVPTMLAAIGGTWGIQGVCTGNYYGPRINTGGNFPADMSAGGMRGNNFDVVTGFTDGTTLHQPFSNDSAERFAPLGLQVGYNRSAGRGESNIYVGAGNGSPGGFDFIKVIGISVQAPSSYDPATAIVTLTTRTPHGLVVGSRFNLSLVLGTDSIGFTDGRDIQKLGGNWIATADNVGTSGTVINFVLTQNVLGVPTPYTGLDILTITAGAINASALDSGVIDTSVGLPVAVSNSGTLGLTTGGSLLAVDGYANTRLSGALVHGAIKVATLANGGTVTVPQNTSFMLVNNSSSIATGSLVLPAPAANSFQTIGSQLDVRFQNPVGTLTVTAATGAAVAGPPTTVLSGGASFRFIQGGPGAAANTWLPCIPDVSGTPPVGGPYLPTSGGAVTGPLTINGLLTTTAGITGSGINSTPIGATTPSTGAFTNLSATGTVTLPPGTVMPPSVIGTNSVAIQAAHDALPATGGTILLGPNTVYDITGAVTISKPNVRITASSWSTVLRRNAANTTGGIITTTTAATGFVCEGFTVDGNAVVMTGPFEVGVAGANSLVRNMQIINSAATGHLNLSGQNSRATGNTIRGLGTSPSTQRGYGIWAISHATVMIDHNTITGTGIDGIGFDGQGTQVIGNTVSGCHCWTGGQGGQIASYYTTLGGVGNSSAMVGNFIGPAGSAQGSGIESWVPGAIISGNTFDGIQAAAITMFGNGTTVTGNSIRNCGGSVDAIVVTANVTDFVISGNRIADDQTTPTMRAGISIYAGTSDRFTVIGNLITGWTSFAIWNLGTGLNRTITNNMGSATGVVSSNLLYLGTQQIGDGTGVAQLAFAGAATSSPRGMLFHTGAVGANSERWNLTLSAGAESGGNVSSNLALGRWSDTGVFLATVWSIARATGLTTYTGAVQFNGQVGFNSTAPIAKPAGWGTSTGGARAAITGSSTLPQVAAGLAQLLNDLTAYGLIGT